MSSSSPPSSASDPTSTGTTSSSRSSSRPEKDDHQEEEEDRVPNDNDEDEDLAEQKELHKMLHKATEDHPSPLMANAPGRPQPAPVLTDHEKQDILLLTGSHNHNNNNNNNDHNTNNSNNTTDANADATTEAETFVPGPAELQRGRPPHHHNLTQPGAVRLFPRGYQPATHDNDTVDVDTVDMDDHNGPDAPPPPPPDNHNHNQDLLVVAHLVPEEEDVERAVVTTQQHNNEPIVPAQRLDFNSTEVAHKFLATPKGRCLVASVAVLVIGLIVAVVVAVQTNNGNSGNNENNNNDNNTVTAAPTTPLVPFSRDMLPHYTLDVLDQYEQQQQSNATTSTTNTTMIPPQVVALEWLYESISIDLEETTMPAARALQRFAMATIYFATTTNSSSWKNQQGWLDPEQHECTWYQQGDENDDSSTNTSSTAWHCTETGEVTELDLTDNHLAGRLPPEIAILAPTLQTLRLDENQLTGPLPLELALLTSLQHFTASANWLQKGEDRPNGGAIDRLLCGELVQLQELALQENRFTGRLPLCDYTATALTDLRLAKNAWTGSLPTQLGRLTHLQTLWLHSLPGMSDNRVPSELGQLTQLQTLLASKANVTGPFPDEFWNMTSLQMIKIQDNPLLSGSLPSMLGNLRLLSNLKLERTGVGGSLPSEMGLLTDFQWIRMGENAFTGALPTQLGLLTVLNGMALHHNQFTSSIPTQFGQLSLLEDLTLDNNRLTGPIPSQLGNLRSVEELRVSGNDLSGTIPVQLLELPGVETLELFGNPQLSGSVPADVCTARGGNFAAAIVDCGNVTCDCCTCAQDLLEP